MAKHSKWHNIRHKKAATDAKKSKIYSKIGKLIEIAARSGSDPTMNPSLDTVLQKAKYNSLPKEVIEKAIKKGSGQSSGENFETIFYEGYGPGGCAVLVRALTSNRNRTSGNVRLYFSKYGGSLGEPGSVAWQFKEKGRIVIEGKLEQSIVNGKKSERMIPLDEGEIELQALERGCEDISLQEGIAELITSSTDFVSIRKQVEVSGYQIMDAGIVFLAENNVDLDDEQYATYEKLIEALEEDDDVDEVWGNV